jgi:hypothetical protein
MAAISYVFTIRRAAQILGRDEDLLWDLSDQLEPEDGKLWIHDIDGAEILAFSEDLLEGCPPRPRGMRPTSSDGDVIRCVAPWPGTAARLLVHGS